MNMQILSYFSSFACGWRLTTVKLFSVLLMPCYVFDSNLIIVILPHSKVSSQLIAQSDRRSVIIITTKAKTTWILHIYFHKFHYGSSFGKYFKLYLNTARRYSIKIAKFSLLYESEKKIKLNLEVFGGITRGSFVVVGGGRRLTNS